MESPQDFALNLERIPDGDLVLHLDREYTQEALYAFRAQLESVLPNRKIIVLHSGARLESIDSNRRLDAIERKLDALINASSGVFTGGPK